MVPKGIVANPGDMLGYQYYSFATSSEKPLVFQFRTSVPVCYEPNEGCTIANMEVSHSKLGSGQVHGFSQYLRGDNNTSFSTRAVISF